MSTISVNDAKMYTNVYRKLKDGVVDGFVFCKKFTSNRI